MAINLWIKGQGHS